MARGPRPWIPPWSHLAWSKAGGREAAISEALELAATAWAQWVCLVLPVRLADLDGIGKRPAVPDVRPRRSVGDVSPTIAGRVRIA
ncbi:MAG: hypothetical protein ACYDAD_12165 [Acidimicrobiales bacterium]